MKKLVAVLVVLNALAWSFALIPRVESTGSLSIPNTISAQPAGNLAAALLDANWSTIASYVNAREITIGAFSTRPAASVSGRYFLASDINLGTLYVDTGSAWTQVAAGVTATTTYTNELASLTLINSSSTNINVTPGAAASDDTTFTNRVLMTLSSNLIKLVDAAWVVGSNQGCLDTGTAPVLGTYHFFAIQRTDTNVVDALCSTSATNPTLPANYSKKRRLGSVLRWTPTGSTVNQLASFTQTNDTFLLNSPFLDINATNPGTAAVTQRMSIASGVRVNGLFSVFVAPTTSGTDAFFCYLSSTDAQDMAPSITLSPLMTYKGSGGGNVFAGGTQASVRTDLTGAIRFRCGTASGAADVLRAVSLGWVDTDRRN